MSECRLILGDCLGEMAKLSVGSVDLVLTDPPYPEIDRAYGRLTEAQWWEMMRVLVPEVRRVLRPRGSAVFILQPNSERVGRMRTWLWEFMTWVGKEWGIVQDAYWWNYVVAPTVHVRREHGGLRPSVKMCVWCGSPDCYRNQDNVLWEASEATKTEKRAERTLYKSPSGGIMRRGRCLQASKDRDGVTPFNLLPIANTNNSDSAGVYGHGAGTPLPLCSWWVRYLCPPSGTVLDPFSGSGTVGLAALAHGCGYIGMERMPEYHAIAQRRLAEVCKPDLFGETHLIVEGQPT